MKEYKITYKEESYYAGMYDNKTTKVTIIEAETAKKAVEKFYEEYPDRTGKGSTKYTFLDISLL